MNKVKILTAVAPFRNQIAKNLTFPYIRVLSQLDTFVITFFEMPKYYKKNHFHFDTYEFIAISE